MKRLSSSDSLAAVISIRPPSTEDKSSEGNRGFKSILDGLEDEEYIEESGQPSEKKRRLTNDQVKALEKTFEVENKLEPERKVKLAQELGLQPRQVAVWFQNRRARWKTKQLEKDYGLLKANYDALKLNYDSLHQDKEALLAEIGELKVKQQREEKRTDSIFPIIKEEMVLSESHNKDPELNQVSGASRGSEKETNHDPDHSYFRASICKDLKDRSSDSDCSVILNEENSPNGAISLENFPQQMVGVSPFTSSFRSDCCYSMSSSSFNCMPFEDSKVFMNTQKACHQFLKMEENGNYFNAEEPCSFFSDEEASILSWFPSEQWT